MPSAETAVDGSRVKGLQKDALGLTSSIVIGLASTAPAYSLTVTLGFVVAEVGSQAPAIMMLAFIPNACIAVACHQLNRMWPDCGSSFVWVRRAFGPLTGWIAAWAMLATDIIVMATFAQVAAVYAFRLVGADALAESDAWQMVGGTAWIAVLTWISLRKIQVSMRAQWVWLVLEITILLALAVVALVRVHAGGAAPGAIPFSWRWFDPFVLDAAATSRGVLIALFIYWGWDTVLSINEETRRCERTPGRAGILSTVLLLTLYFIVTFAMQAFAGVGSTGIGLGNPNLREDVLAVMGDAIFGGGVAGRVLVLCTLTSAIASAQTTLLPAARLALSMACFGALPKFFAQLHPRDASPANATLVMGLLSALLFLGLSIAGADVLADTVEAISLLIALYYALTGFACVWLFRKSLRHSIRDLCLKGLVPLAGSSMLTIALVVRLPWLIDPTAHKTSWAGIGGPLWIDAAALITGVAVMGWRYAVAPGFFRGTVDRALQIRSETRAMDRDDHGDRTPRTDREPSA